MLIQGRTRMPISDNEESLGSMIRSARYEIDAMMWQGSLKGVDDRYIIRWAGLSCDSAFIMLKEVEDPPKEGKGGE